MGARKNEDGLTNEQELAIEAVEFLREALKPKGKAVWLTAKGVYEIDHSYNPPRVTKIEEKNAKD